jgi:hypothetical protein
MSRIVFAVMTLLAALVISCNPPSGEGKSEKSKSVGRYVGHINDGYGGRRIYVFEHDGNWIYTTNDSRGGIAVMPKKETR